MVLENRRAAGHDRNGQGAEPARETGDHRCGAGSRAASQAGRDATSYGLKVAFFYAKVYLRILRPNWAALIPADDSLPRSLRAALDQLDAEIQKHEEAAIAA